MNIDDLCKIGFIYAGKWVLSEDNTLDFILENCSNNENILYAFVVDKNIMYIGKSKRSLHQRMYNYKKNEKSQTTNVKNNKNIIDFIKDKKDVLICVFIDNGLFSYGQFRISLSAGLEDSMINTIQPRWNDIK